MWREDDYIAVMSRLRRQIIVHSVIYYHFNRNLILDGEYDELCVKLYKMQQEHPLLCQHAAFAEDFIDYDPSTGMNFAEHEWGLRAANRLLNSIVGGRRRG